MGAERRVVHDLIDVVQGVVKLPQAPLSRPQRRWHRRPRPRP
jgi:septum formation inhibitor-activating ATPase MinD